MSVNININIENNLNDDNDIQNYDIEEYEGDDEDITNTIKKSKYNWDIQKRMSKYNNRIS